MQIELTIFYLFFDYSGSDWNYFFSLHFAENWLKTNMDVLFIQCLLKCMHKSPVNDKNKQMSLGLKKQRFLFSNWLDCFLFLLAPYEQPLSSAQWASHESLQVLVFPRSSLLVIHISQHAKGEQTTTTMPRLPMTHEFSILTNTRYLAKLQTIEMEGKGEKRGKGGV